MDKRHKQDERIMIDKNMQKTAVNRCIDLLSKNTMVTKTLREIIIEAYAQGVIDASSIGVNNG